MSELKGEISKRQSLNTLTQGAAVHLFTTAHNLANAELEKLDPELLRLYTIFTNGSLGPYWGYIGQMMDPRGRFWSDAAAGQGDFGQHPVLGRHGGTLSKQAKTRHEQLAQRHGLPRDPQHQMGQLMQLYSEIMRREQAEKPQLEALAKQITEEVWQFPQDRMKATLTVDMHQTANAGGGQASQMLQQAKIGTVRIVRTPQGLAVDARAHIFPVLVQELSKGVMEILSLHGLSSLDDQTYDEVIGQADRLEHEPWLIQAGPELWRKLLAIKPRTIPLGKLVAKLASLKPDALHHFLDAVVKDPEWAKELIEKLFGQVA